PGPVDIRRLQRPGFPECVQGFAAAARVATAARFQERAIRDATPLDRLGWRWPLDLSNTQRTTPRQCACDRAGAWRRKLATAGVRRHVGGRAYRARREDSAASTRQLRLHRRLVGHLPRPLRRPTPKRGSVVVWRAHG